MKDVIIFDCFSFLLDERLGLWERLLKPIPSTLAFSSPFSRLLCVYISEIGWLHM